MGQKCSHLFFMTFTFFYTFLDKSQSKLQRTRERHKVTLERLFYSYLQYQEFPLYILLPNIHSHTNFNLFSSILSMVSCKQSPISAYLLNNYLILSAIVLAKLQTDFVHQFLVFSLCLNYPSIPTMISICNRFRHS